MRIATLLLAVLTFCFSASTPSKSAELCFNKPAKNWLVGKWSWNAQTWNFEIKGDELIWSWVRGEGLVTQKWGLKKPAKGEGKVTNIEGCSLRLNGTYTSYDGSSAGDAVGDEIIYKLEMFNGTSMEGTGYGHGKEDYNVRMYKVALDEGASNNSEPLRLADISGSFIAKFHVRCKKTYDIELAGNVESGIVSLSTRRFGDTNIKIAEDGYFKKKAGMSENGQADVFFKGRVRQDDMEIGMYSYKAGTEQLYCFGKGTSKIK